MLIIPFDTGQCATGNFEYIENLQPHGIYSINFFKDNGIKIKRICVNTLSSTVFWITESGKVYGNGYSRNHQLGSIEKHPTPIIITALKNVIDIQSNWYYSIALCSNITPNTTMIIVNWTRLSHIEISSDSQKYINLP